MAERTWLSFNERPAKGKTQVWDVRSSVSDQMLGSIGWYSPWRRYVFAPIGPATLFDSACLTEIANWCSRKTLERKEARLHERKEVCGAGRDAEGSN